MIYILLILAFVIIYYVIDTSVRTEGFIKVVFLFTLFAFLYYLGLPFEMVIKGTSIGAGGYISERVLMIVISMGVLSLVGFMLGFKLSGYKFRVIESFDLGESRLLFSTVLILTILSGIILFTFFRNSLLSSSSSYAGNFTETYNNPIYAYLKEIFISSGAILILIMTLKERWYYLFVAILLSFILIIFGIITSDKDPLLLSALAWGVYFFMLLTKTKIQKTITLGLLFLLLAVLIPSLSLLFGLNRSSKVSEFTNQLETNGIYANFDASGPLVSLVETIDDPNVNFKYGKSYYWGFIGWIPKSIWANRPLDLSEEYAKEKIKNWQPGQGLGYSLMTEAYKNFGVSGALIQYLLIGLFIGLMGKFFQWIFREPTAPFVFFIWMSYNIAIMHRGPFNLPSTYIRFVLPLLVSYYGLKFLQYLYFKWIPQKE